MARAEHLHLLADEQAGSRKNRMDSLAGLDKVLTADLVRFRHWSAAITSNDAKSCYDRIILWISALVLRRVGINPSATREMMETLQSLAHSVCTAFGESTTTYGDQVYPPFQGSGQGNGAGPTIWALINSLLFSIMQSHGFGLNLTTCLSILSVSMVGFAFVDDTDIIHAAQSPHTGGHQIGVEMQQSVTC